MIWNRHHLQRVLTTYLGHCNTARPHRGIHLEVAILGENRPRRALIRARVSNASTSSAG